MTIPKQSMFNKYISLIIVILLFVSVAVNFVNNSSSGILGKDESLYIFLAKGHDSNTPIGAPTGSWLDAIEKGVQRTTDPPGFFILLHFWELNSFSEIWLRLLPLLFFVISVFTVIKIGLLLRFSFILSVCLGFLPLASQRMVLHALELRAYGMEICLTYIMIFFALKIILKINEFSSPDKSDWFILSLVMIGGLSTRFSFVISSFSMYMVLWLVVMLRMKYSYFKNNLISVAISSIISLIFFAIFFQMKPYLGTNTSVNSVSPDFYDYTIPGSFINIIGYFIKQILLIPMALFGGAVIEKTFYYYIIIILIVGLTSIGLISAYNFIRNFSMPKFKTDLIIYCVVLLYPIFSLLISCFLAIHSIHPFSIASRYSIYLQPSFHLFIIGLGLLFTSQTGNSLEKGSIVFNSLYRTSFSVIVAIMALIYGFSYLSYKHTFRMGGAQHTTSVINNMIKDQELKNIDYWYISVGEADSFKYHVLYGGLKGKLSPKANIIIENRPVTVNKVTCSELETIYKNAEINSKIVMLLGHVNNEEAKVYRDIFDKYFNNVKYGKHETSSEQLGFAVR